MLLACCPCVSALNPSLSIDQYAHAAWKNSEGFSKGIGQRHRPDARRISVAGYRVRPAALRWRSDGPVDAASRSATSRQRYLEVCWSPAMALFGSAGGDGLGQLEGRQAHSRTRNLPRAKCGRAAGGSGRGDMGGACRARRETLRDSERQRAVLRRGRQFRQRTQSSRYMSTIVISGWARKTGLWRWKPVLRNSIRYRAGPAITDLIEGDNGALWLAMIDGIRRFVDGRARGVSRFRALGSR